MGRGPGDTGVAFGAAVTTSELFGLVVLAVVWWIPTLLAFHDLGQREDLDRMQRLRYGAVLLVPVAGPLWYRGRRGTR